MTPLLEQYRKLLLSVDCIISENDDILYKRDSKADPEKISFKVNGIEKALVLPTAKLLKDGQWDKLVAFHPTSESIVHGQSEVINVLIGLIANKIYLTTQRIVAGIITLALNKKAHGKLSLAQRELLDLFTVDDHVEKLAIDVTNKQTGVSGRYPLLSIRLERGGEIDGEQYSRICKLITHVINKDTICGVTGSNAKAKQTLKDIYAYVLPKNLIVGSNSVECPYFMALLNCYYTVSKHLNGIKEVLGTYAPVDSVNVNWYENIKDLPKLGKKYLPQPMQGNIGVSLKTNVPVAEEEPDKPVLDLAQHREFPKQQSTKQDISTKALEDVKVSNTGLQLVPLTHSHNYQQQISNPIYTNPYPQQQVIQPTVINNGPKTISQQMLEDKRTSMGVGNSAYITNSNQNVGLFPNNNQYPIQQQNINPLFGQPQQQYAVNNGLGNIQIPRTGTSYLR